jgi:hypothetical protein
MAYVAVLARLKNSAALIWLIWFPLWSIIIDVAFEVAV